MKLTFISILALFISIQCTAQEITQFYYLASETRDTLSSGIFKVVKTDTYKKNVHYISFKTIDTVKSNVFYGIAGIQFDSAKYYFRKYINLRDKGVPDSLNKFKQKLISYNAKRNN